MISGSFAALSSNITQLKAVNCTRALSPFWISTLLPPHWGYRNTAQPRQTYIHPPTYRLPGKAARYVPRHLIRCCIAPFAFGRPLRANSLGDARHKLAEYTHSCSPEEREPGQLPMLLLLPMPQDVCGDMNAGLDRVMLHPFFVVCHHLLLMLNLLELTISGGFVFFQFFLFPLFVMFLARLANGR